MNMLQGLLSSPNMEVLSAVDNSQLLWSCFATGQGADSNLYHAAAIEAILSRASLGLMSTSDYQTMAQYGLLNHPGILEGMDETQVNLPSPSCVNPGLSSSSTTTSSSLGVDNKPLNNIYIMQPPEATNLMLGFSQDLSIEGQAGICAKKRSWQEALSSPPQANHCISDTIVSSNENGSHVIYSVNDSKASIANLAYPCTLVGSTHEGQEPPYPANIDMAAYMKPMLGCKELEESAIWQENLQISCHQRQFSKSSNVDMESAKDVMSKPEHTTAPIIDGPLRGEINDSCHLSLYKEGALHEYHSNEKEATIALTAIPQTRKRPAAVAHLPDSSSSYSKRAHLQNVKGVVSTTSATATTTTTTTSAATKSSKSSSRNPHGPALNTNGRPRALQGSANDPQSVAARNRRERINARLKVLQELVPNGSKVDLVTMLEKAINYVKYLQLQLRVLSNDDLWQASQENLSEKTATTRSEDGYNVINNVACSDTSETHYTYMGDNTYKP